MIDDTNYFGIKLVPERDNNLTPFAKELLGKFYHNGQELTIQQNFAKAALAYSYGDLEFSQRIYDYASKGWFMYASPVLSNAPGPGEIVKGLSISCFLNFVDDSISGLNEHTVETRLLSVAGGGIGAHWSNVRSVSKKSPGPIPFLQTMNADIEAYKQGSTRKGSYSCYMDISHPDIEEFINIKVPTGGDINRKAMNLFPAVNITDNFMNAVINDELWNLVDPHDKETKSSIRARELWERVLEIRARTGVPYIHFIDESNRKLPQPLKDKGLKINGSNLCIVGSDRVVTDKGLLTIKELYDSKETFNVYDNTNIYSASPMQLIEENVPVYKITLENGMSHTVTSYHKVKTNKGDVSCEDLKIGDSVAIQTHKGIFGKKSMEDEAFLLGLYQADGTQDERNIMIDIWENDFDLEDEIIERFHRVFDKYDCGKPHILRKDGEFSKRVLTKVKFTECNVSQSNVRKKRLASPALKRALDFKKGSVPQWIWESNEKTQWQYIRGLFYADGTVNINGSKGNPIYLSLCSINKLFLENIQILLHNLGMQTSIRIAKLEGKSSLPDGNGGYKLYDSKTAYRIIIGNKNDALEFEKNTQFLTRKEQVLEDRVYRDNTKKFYKVKTIQELDRQDVFCTTVHSDSHHWIVNGIISHNCSEITLPTAKDRTAVCCLSSLNLAKYDEWKDTNIVKDLIRFLDNVLQFFIDNCPDTLYKAKFSATQERSLGLGTLGWHDYLQSHMIPWESAIAKAINIQIFEKIKSEALEATKELALEKGEYPDGIGSGARNSHLLAIAPNANSSIIVGASPSIEPVKSNAFMHKTRAGSFLVKNKYLEKILEDKYMPKEDSEKWLKDTWKSIILKEGSVQHLDFMSNEDKIIFKTAFEIDQNWVIQHASDRQPFICQAQSVNLYFPAGSERAYVNKVHLKAWKEKLKSLYYFRTSSLTPADKISIKQERVPLADYAKSEEDECLACHA